MKPRGIKTSMIQVGYKRPKNKNPKSEEERRHERNSLVIKNIYNGGGDGCA